MRPLLAWLLAPLAQRTSGVALPAPDQGAAAAEYAAVASTPAPEAHDEVAAEQAAFLAQLAHSTGRSLEEWMHVIDASLPTAVRNGIIDLLGTHGFPFRWASVIERAYAARHPGYYGLRAAGCAPDAPPAPTGLAGGLAPAAEPARPALLHREPAEHAEALLKWLWAAGGHSGRAWASEVTAAYAKMCAAHRWAPHDWNQTGARFRQLVVAGGGYSKYGNRRDPNGGRHRVCYYHLPPAQGGLTRLAARSEPEARAA